MDQDNVATTATPNGIEQRLALEKQKNLSNGLSREVEILRAELDAARLAGKDMIQAVDVGIRQTEELERQRDKTSKLLSELGLVRTELEMTRLAMMNARHDADSKLETALELERNKSETLAGNVAQLERELDIARAAAPETAKAVASGEQQRQRLEAELARQRDQAAAVANELSSRSALLAAADAKAMREEEVRTTLEANLTSERERSTALAQELVLVRSRIEDGARHLCLAKFCDTTGAGGVDQISKSANEGPSPSSDRPLGPTMVSNETPPVAPDTPTDPSSTAISAPATPDPRLARASDRPAPSGAFSRSVTDEPRWLARANALLRDADISGARSLLEHAVERGSARAAFMLAETYNARVLESWRARGISGDLIKARELYERAQAGGIDDAKERLRTLR